MAHAHDRTLLASLAFGDPDKKDPLHDLGCQYVALPNVASALMQQPVLPRLEYVPDAREFREVGLEPLFFRRGRIEVPVEKGVNQYKTTIGFVDVALVYETRPKNPLPIRAVATFVEVKIGPVSLGDVVRQIKLYSSYITEETLKRIGADVEGVSRPPWILAAAFEMSANFVEGLRAENIIPVHLGENFRKWAAEQQNSPRAADVKSI